MITASALLIEAETLLAARQLAEAVKCFLTAEVSGADPDRCAAGRWQAYMLAGQFESAWQQSDAIRRRMTPDPHRLWQGESLAGKRIILRCLHGFGDAVQFLRYMPRLRTLASSVIVEVSPRLIDLARCCEGVDEVITWGETAPLHPPLWDVQIEIMELPYIFRTQLSDLPLATRYLQPPAPRAFKPNHPGRLQVGLAQNAGAWNPARAIAMELLQPILAVPGCEFWNLDGGPDRVPGTQPVAFPLHQDAFCRDSVAGLAATISQLDLVITVDTLAAHLAGALDVQAWVLLQHEADWRWMHARHDSPWYPSLELFRQPSAGDWASVIGTVSHALQKKVTTNASRRATRQPA